MNKLGLYYMNKVGKFPDDIQCIRPAPPEGKLYPGAELVRILPVTPEPVICNRAFTLSKISPI